jgi:hypothetical protein
MLKIYVEDIIYLHILFPEYQKYEGKLEDSLLDNRKVYIIEGDENVVLTAEYLQTLKSDILYVITLPSYTDYSFESSDDVVEYLIQVRSFKDTRYVKSKFKHLLEEEKIEFLKLSLALGKWYMPYLKHKTKVYEMFEAFHLSSIPLLKQWYKLVPEYTVPRLYSSLLTFLVKLISYTEIESSLPKWYRNILRMSHIQNFDIEGALDLMKLTNVPYSALIPAFLLRSRKKVKSEVC